MPGVNGFSGEWYLKLCSACLARRNEKEIHIHIHIHPLSPVIQPILPWPPLDGPYCDPGPLPTKWDKCDIFCGSGSYSAQPDPNMVMVYRN